MPFLPVCLFIKYLPLLGAFFNYYPPRKNARISQRSDTRRSKAVLVQRIQGKELRRRGNMNLGGLITLISSPTTAPICNTILSLLVLLLVVQSNNCVVVGRSAAASNNDLTTTTLAFVSTAASTGNNLTNR